MCNVLNDLAQIALSLTWFDGRGRVRERTLFHCFIPKLEHMIWMGNCV